MRHGLRAVPSLWNLTSVSSASIITACVVARETSLDRDPDAEQNNTSEYQDFNPCKSSISTYLLGSLTLTLYFYISPSDNWFNFNVNSEKGLLVSLWWDHMLLTYWIPGGLLLTLTFPAWLSNHMPSKVWNEITYRFPNVVGCTVEIYK